MGNIIISGWNIPNFTLTVLFCVKFERIAVIIYALRIVREQLFGYISTRTQVFKVNLIIFFSYFFYLTSFISSTNLSKSFPKIRVRNLIHHCLKPFSKFILKTSMSKNYNCRDFFLLFSRFSCTFR